MPEWFFARMQLQQVDTIPICAPVDLKQNDIRCKSRERARAILECPESGSNDNVQVKNSKTLSNPGPGYRRWLCAVTPLCVCLWISHCFNGGR